MGIFYITRKQFLDRTFRLDELAAMTEMLLHWYRIRTGDAAARGNSYCQAIIYAFPRHDGPAIRQSLAAEAPEAQFDLSNPDEVRVVGPQRSAGNHPDISLWRVVLCQPALQHVCLLLRFTIEGPMRISGEDDGTTTVVLCGAPAAGATLVKAIWALGFDPSLQLVYRAAPWPKETKFVEAFDLYQRQRATGTPELGAKWSHNLFGEDVQHLFRGRSTERKVLWLTRHLAELPDDRGVKRFLLRLSTPMLAGACLLAVAIVYRSELPLAFWCGLAALFALSIAGRIVWKKIRRIGRYYKTMRSGLGKLYSNPIERKQIDLSDDKTPTLLKCSAELAALGARHLCDISISTARGVFDGNRVYTLGDTAITIALLRKFDALSHFPPRPILHLTTRFKDGRKHFTVNIAIYRKQPNRKTTGRCLLDEGGVDDVVALHRRQVDKLIATGAVPLPPPTSLAQAIDQMRQDDDESRQAGQKSPYSWGDALHQAFKVCRREYLAD